jgi:hypothetical protein
LLPSNTEIKGYHKSKLFVGWSSTLRGCWMGLCAIECLIEGGDHRVVAEELSKRGLVVAEPALGNDVLSFASMHIPRHTRNYLIVLTRAALSVAVNRSSRVGHSRRGRLGSLRLLCRFCIGVCKWERMSCLWLTRRMASVSNE